MCRHKSAIRLQARSATTQPQNPGLNNWFNQKSWYTQAKHLALYWPMPFEVDCRALLWQRYYLGQRCYLPHLKKPEKKLAFYAFNPHQFRINPNGLGESLRPAAMIHVHQLDVIIIPIQGISLYGYRIGFGQGYYDRTLRYVRHRDPPRRIAIGYQGQVHQFSPELWDVPVHDIILVGRTIQHYAINDRLAHGA